MSGTAVVYKVFEGENDADYQKQEIVWVAAPSSETHKAEWWPGIVSKDSVGNPSVEVSYITPHPFPKKLRKLEKSRIQILEFQMKLLKHLTPGLSAVRRKFDNAMLKAKKLDKEFVSRWKNKNKRNQENHFSPKASGKGKKKTKKSKSPSKKKLIHKDPLPPDPPEVYPCMKTLQDLKIIDQKDLVLFPGDRIWFKSAIYGDRYLKAIIKEIYPGPGRSINLDIFESPTLSTPIQKYELKDGKEWNRLPREGRIMLRYWTLVPGRFKPASCPFNQMALDFMTAAKNASKDLKEPAKLFLNKLKYPKTEVEADWDEDSLGADLDFLDDKSNDARLTHKPKRKKRLKKKKSKLDNSRSSDKLSLSPMMKTELSLSPLNIRKKRNDFDTNLSTGEAGRHKKRSSVRKRKKHINTSNDLNWPLLSPRIKHKQKKRKRKISTRSPHESQSKIDNTSWWKKKRDLVVGNSSCSLGSLIDYKKDQVVDTRPRRDGAHIGMMIELNSNKRPGTMPGESPDNMAYCH